MKKYLAGIAIIFASLIAYFSSLNYGFSQDDFIHLYSSSASSISAFLNFFNPFFRYPDIFFYRPLSTQVYFFINTTLFALNPLPFHIEGLILHSINSVIFYSLIKKIWQNSKIAFTSATFYAVSAVHFLSLYYISAFQEIARIFFILLFLLIFLNYLESKKKRLYLLSIAFFIASLLSKETSLVAPLLLFPLIILKQKEQPIFLILKSTFKLMIPLFIVVIIYLGIRTTGLQSIFSEGAYNTTFSLPQILQNLKWYVVWTVGLPEILSSYPSLKPQSLIQFGKDLPFGNILIGLSLVFIVISGLLLFKFKTDKRILLASLSLFLIPLLPVLVLQGHRYPQYLDLSFLGVLPIMAYMFLQKAKIKRVLGIAGITIFILIQIFSIKLSEQTHWTTKRAQVANYYYESIKKAYPNLPDNSEVNFIGTEISTRELSFALAQKYALLVWYPNKVKKVNYSSGLITNDALIIFPITIY